MLKLSPPEVLQRHLQYLRDWVGRRLPGPGDRDALITAMHCMQRELDFRVEVAEWGSQRVSDGGILEALESIYANDKVPAPTTAQLHAECSEMARAAWGKSTTVNAEERVEGGQCRVLVWGKDRQGRLGCIAMFPWEQDRRQALWLLRTMLRAKTLNEGL